MDWDWWGRYEKWNPPPFDWEVGEMENIGWPMTNGWPRMEPEPFDVGWERMVRASEDELRSQERV